MQTLYSLNPAQWASLLVAVIILAIVGFLTVSRVMEQKNDNGKIPVRWEW